MPQAPPFAGPRKRSARHQSLRARQHGQTRKRKRDDADDGDEPDDASDHASSSAEHDTPSTRPLSSAINTLTAAQAHQFRTAGHDPELPLPKPPFPHAPVSVKHTRHGEHQRPLRKNACREDKFTPAELQRELAALRPPLYTPRLSAAARLPQARAERHPRGPSLPGTRRPELESDDGNHWRHRLVHEKLATMHRCLLQGDYHRAGLVWKEILQIGRGAMKVDERVHARWGLAAEMHLNTPKASAGNLSEVPSATIDDANFTEDGFKAARLYYERLILDHPFRQSNPKATSALTFYPAMFSLWLYEISQASRAAMTAARRSELDGEDVGSDVASDSEFLKRHTSAREVRILAVRTDELRRAREIAARLDDLLSSPHFDKRPELLHLRGMIAIWIGDLIAQNRQSERIIDGHTPSEDESEMRDDADREEHTNKAKALFQLAKTFGGRLSDGATQTLNAVED
ncbi:transcription initiation factor rrn11 [Diplodia corticola]|uniref:Transcription initiation factor rrn11 n=1 Tax=Diplodia corticola TaxID=236234 RepID=A0A1J9QRU9_9PEZI|nr:transcription initiation factor rrn11 [Diplodia corticola]OJD31670.1 transcription initiation factor rrn11 [Diplodia corticola]